MPALRDWMRPADDETVRQWLGDLGVLIASAMTVDEARAKLAAYTSLLTEDYPRAAFTRRTLATAGRRFKYFPTFGELCDFLDDTRGDLRVKVGRVQALAKPQQPPRNEPDPECVRPRTEEEIARVRAYCASIGIPAPDAPMVKRFPGNRD